MFILCDKAEDANLILISFRGTEPFNADDWSTDFDYSWYETPNLGKVHMGFLEAMGLGNRANTLTFLNNLQDSEEKSGSEMEEMEAYYTVRRKLKRLLSQHKNAKFIVTGHSLGGALAILFPMILVLHEEVEVMQRLLGVYTFGQPRVGDSQLRRSMEAQLNFPVERYFRVVYCNDLVPRLPYDDKTFLYKHFGVCLYYDSLYHEQVTAITSLYQCSFATLMFSKQQTSSSTVGSTMSSIFICYEHFPRTNFSIHLCMCKDNGRGAQ